MGRLRKASGQVVVGAMSSCGDEERMSRVVDMEKEFLEWVTDELRLAYQRGYLDGKLFGVAGRPCRNLKG